MVREPQLFSSTRVRKTLRPAPPPHTGARSHSTGHARQHARIWHRRVRQPHPGWAGDPGCAASDSDPLYTTGSPTPPPAPAYSQLAGKKAGLVGLDRVQTVTDDSQLTGPRQRGAGGGGGGVFARQHRLVEAESWEWAKGKRWSPRGTLGRGTLTLSALNSSEILYGGEKKKTLSLNSL